MNGRFDEMPDDYVTLNERTRRRLQWFVAVVGAFMMAVGVVFACVLFAFVMSALRSPRGLAEPIEAWQEVLSDVPAEAAVPAAMTSAAADDAGTTEALVLSAAGVDSRHSGGKPRGELRLEYSSFTMLRVVGVVAMLLFTLVGAKLAVLMISGGGKLLLECAKGSPRRKGAAAPNQGWRDEVPEEAPE